MTLTQLFLHPAYETIADLAKSHGRSVFAQELAGALFLQFTVNFLTVEVVEICDEADVERVRDALAARVSAEKIQERDSLRAKCVPIESLRGDIAAGRTLGDVWGAMAETEGKR